MQALSATDKMRQARPDGSVSSADVVLGGSVITIAEAQSQSGSMPSMIHLYVADADATYGRALAGTSLREPADQPYGDRIAGLKDQFGNQWWIATMIASRATTAR